MERLSIEEIIKHCNRHLNRFPSGTRNYQEHESTGAYLQMLRHYQKIGTVEEFAALVQADSEDCKICIWKNRHQKCACCKRNRHLKDCFAALAAKEGERE